ncbi:dephospho-CoA kinase-like isoform X3 [Phoenix dactylifera]|uniref:Dephospho-CoA kinase-like isoform X3 n=1 Tax=Phoenix dactylifera TaxID=42345 RepID=A0A8B8J992_PHODC|nr:dephospho-CoA kinase-like isoform X3 [Phoenix dactylifera]
MAVRGRSDVAVIVERSLGKLLGSASRTAAMRKPSKHSELALSAGEEAAAIIGRVLLSDPRARPPLEEREGDEDRGIDGRHHIREEHCLQSLQIPRRPRRGRRPRRPLLAPYISFGIFWEVVKLWIKGSKLIILDIPLLFEAKMDRWTAPIIVVWVDPETQVTRLMARDGISEEQAKSKINAQTALDWKKTKAHIVIDNSGTLEETKLQFQEVLNQVSRPLTWKEFAFSREGVFWILVSSIAGVLVVQKNLKR